MGSKPTSQTNSSQTFTPPPAVLQNYQQVTSQAQNVAATPYQGYGGQLVSPINQQQSAGIGAINSASGLQNPYNAGATGLAAASAASINPQQFSSSALQEYENPYQSQVINATEAEIQQQNAQQAAALQSNSISSGAFGGDRAGVAQAALAGQQDIANNATLAGLNSQNFQNALGEFNTQQGVGLAAGQNTAQRQLAASQQLGTLGNTAQTEALNEANAQTNAGTLQQTTQQAQDTAAYNQFLQQQAYPFQTTGWLANIVEGIGSQSGGASTGSSETENNVGSSIFGGLLGLGGLFAPKSRGGVVSFLERGGRIGAGGLVRKATGGGLVVPYVGDESGIGSGSIVPTSGLAVGHTMPNAAPMMAGAGQSPAQQGQNITQIARGVQGLGNAFENSSLGDSFNDALQDFGDGFARGGLVARGYAGGGLVPRRYANGGWATGGLLAGGGFGGSRDPYDFGNGKNRLFANGGGVGGGLVGPVGRARGGLVVKASGGLVGRRQYDDGGIVQYDPSQGLGNGDLTPEALARYGTEGAATPNASPAFVQPSQIASPSWANAAAGIPTPEAAMAAQYTNQMPAPQQSGLSPSQKLAIAMGSPMAASGDALSPAAPAGLVGAYSDTTPASGLGLLRTAMGGSDPALADSNAAYGDIDAHGNAVPAPPIRPVGLGLISPASGSAYGPPSSPASSDAMWTAPAYTGPAPKGPAPDPADYPVTPQGQAAFIRDYSAYAGGRGINSNFALGVAHAEGLNNAARGPNLASAVDVDKNGNPFSFGAFQLNVRNGLGNLARASGIDPADPAQANIANKFAMDFMASHGIQPWKGDEAVMAYQGGRGLAAAPAAEAINGATAQPDDSGPTASAYDSPTSGRGGLSVSPPTGLGAVAGNTGAPSASSGGLGGNPITQGIAALFPGLHVNDAERQGIIAAGLGMMAGTSRNAFTNIGQGGLQGLGAYNQARNLESEIGLRQAQGQNFSVEAAKSLAQMPFVGPKAKADLLKAQTEAERESIMVGVLHDALGQHAQDQNAKAAAVAKAVDNGQPAAAAASSAPAVPRGAPTPPGSVQPAKQVIDADNPDLLFDQAQRYAKAGLKDASGQLAAKAKAIMAGEQYVTYSDGSQGIYGTIGQAKAAQAARVKAAEATASVPVTVGQGIAEDDLKKAHDSRAGVQGALYRLGEMDEQIKNLPKTGFLTAGSGATERGQIAKSINTFVQGLGGQPMFDPNNVAAVEQLTKDRFRLGAELSRQIGGKEPGFIVEQSVTANPGADNSRAGYERIVSGLRQATLYSRDYANFLDQYFNQNRTTIGAPEAFERQYPQRSYVERAIASTVDPRDAQVLAQNFKNPQAVSAFDKIYGAGVSNIMKKRNFDVSTGEVLQ